MPRSEWGINPVAGCRWSSAIRKACTAMLAPRCCASAPTDHAAGVRVQHHRNVYEFLLQAYIGDVGYPKFIEVARSQTARQVRPHSPAMLRIGGRGHKAPRAQAEQIVFAHQAQHAFGIDALPPVPHPPLPPSITVKPLLHDDLLDGIAHRRVRLPRRRRPAMPVKSRPAHPAQLAHSFHREAALLGPFRDQRADRFPSTFMRRKASPKKSSSNSCCPTLRSSSAIRFRAASNSPRPAVASNPGTATGCLRGLPTRRCTKPASPNSAYRSFHTYRRLRRIPNSCATALTLSPASTRRTAANFNSVPYSDCFAFFCDMCSPCRELSPLSLSQFWGALHPTLPASPSIPPAVAQCDLLSPARRGGRRCCRRRFPTWPGLRLPSAPPCAACGRMPRPSSHRQ